MFQRGYLKKQPRKSRKSIQYTKPSMGGSLRAASLIAAVDFAAFLCNLWCPRRFPSTVPANISKNFGLAYCWCQDLLVNHHCFTTDLGFHHNFHHPQPPPPAPPPPPPPPRLPLGAHLQLPRSRAACRTTQTSRTAATPPMSPASRTPSTTTRTTASARGAPGQRCMVVGEGWGRFLGEGPC